VRRRVTIALVTVAALAAVGVAHALAQVQDRITLRGQSGNPTDHYSPALAIVAVSPPGYARGCCYDHNGGEWKGPRYKATGDPKEGDVHTFDWSVGVAVQAGGTRAALIANLTQDWPVVSEGRQQIKHRVGGRAAGTIRGNWVLTRSPDLGTNDARIEGMVGFSLCDGNTAFASFDLLIPSSNSASSGEFTINGMRPSDWNAAKAMQSMRGIVFEGNLSARSVTVTARGRRVSGRAADCHKNGLAGLAVQLQQQTGGSWRTVSSARTSAAGTYSFTARSAGTYRVRAGTRTSAPVRVR
jgi:hypothetical protein